MKRDKIIYWIATVLVAAGMLSSAIFYLSQNPELMENFKLIGIPLYIVTLLGVAKLLGAIALVVPKYNGIKEWAYAGFTFNFIGAIWAHVATGTPWFMPAGFLVVLIVSYVFWKRVRK